VDYNAPCSGETYDLTILSVWASNAAHKETALSLKVQYQMLGIAEFGYQHTYKVIAVDHLRISSTTY
jgi:hypothetical protein